MLSHVVFFVFVFFAPAIFLRKLRNKQKKIIEAGRQERPKQLYGLSRISPMILQRHQSVSGFLFFCCFLLQPVTTHDIFQTNPLTRGWWEDARKPPPERAEDCVQSVEAAMMSESRQQEVLWFHTLAGEMKKHELGPVRLRCLWALRSSSLLRTGGPFHRFLFRVGTIRGRRWTIQRSDLPPASPPLAADSLQVLSLAAPTVWTLISAKLPRPNPVSCDTS